MAEANGLHALIAQSMKSFPPTLNLPTEFLALIGQVIAHWAYAEWYLAGILGYVNGMDRKPVRVLFSGVCAPDAVTKIKQVSELKALNIDAQLLSEVAAAVRAGSAARNLVGHAVYAEDNGIVAQDPSGEWKIDGKVVATKRRYPESVPMTLEMLREKLQAIDKAIKLTEELNGQIEKALEGKKA